MRKSRVLVSLILVVAVAVGCMLMFAGCKPGYKEVWADIEPYNYEWDGTNGDIELIISRVNADCIIEKNGERAKLEEEISSSIEAGKEPKPNIYDAKYLLSQLNEDGSFKNIEYDKDTKAFWPPLDHLKYVLNLQVARNDENSPYYMSEDVKAAVSKAMDYWVIKDYTCSWNWWFNEVGVGMYLPNIILFGVDGLSDANRTKMLNKIEGTLLHTKKMRFKLYERKCNEAGGNLADQALSTLKFCLAKGDGNTIMWVTKQIENELRPFPPYKGPDRHRWDAEGVKEDWSFQQHDQLIYFGGYGEVMLDGFNEYIRYTKGTQFALSKEKLEFYADFILNGVQFVTRAGYRDANASGRGAARRNGLKGVYNNVKNTIDILLDNEIRVEELTKLKADRFGEKDKGAGGHRYFYESDYQVINNERYMATVRHASERTRVFEYLNGENPYGFYAGLGSTAFYVDGDEYYNMPVVFDWNKMPGTTTRQGHLPTMNQDFSYNEYGDTKYAQGVSNGKVGVSYIRTNNRGLGARKAYFMFEDGVVCLGSDIHTLLGNEIVTNINQTRWKGDVVVGQNGTATTLSDATSGKFDYVYHNKIAYFTDADVNISMEHREGDWKKINENSGSSYIEQVDVFNIDISHGRRPQGAKYEYTALMDTTPEGAAAYAANPTLKVLANTKHVQAVYDSKNDVTMAVLHRGDRLTLNDGTTLKVSNGAVLIVEKVDGKTRITIASHDYDTHDVNVEFGGNSQKVTIGKKPICIEF